MLFTLVQEPAWGVFLKFLVNKEMGNYRDGERYRERERMRERKREMEREMERDIGRERGRDKKDEENEEIREKNVKIKKTNKREPMQASTQSIFTFYCSTLSHFFHPQITTKNSKFLLIHQICLRENSPDSKYLPH